ncbi:hypothetical protein FQN50_002788 [Emmonsiellopsis sp. PD_5]|nr:hypothetical protein FQN50_002788 [Emmonsiellopsis sp. PD_5]
MASLDHIPEELITEIFNSLDPKDSLNFRLTCRAICNKSSYCVKRRFFKSRRFNFSRRALRTFIQVAKYGRFGSAIEEVSITLTRWIHRNLHAKLWLINQPGYEFGGITHPILVYPRRRWHRGLVEPADSEEDRAEIQRRADECDSRTVDLLDLIEQGEDLTLLVDALKHLPNLRSICLREGPGHCWNGNTIGGAPPCGGPDALEICWGLLGDAMDLRRLQLLERHHLFTQLLSSFSLTGPIPQLTSLDICVSDFEYANEPSTIPTFLSETLQTISLDFIDSYDIRGNSRFGDGVVIPNPLKSGTADDWLVRFVNSCTQLKSLSVHFNNLYMALIIANIGTAMDLPRLERFSLAGYMLDFRTEHIYSRLVRFLSHHSPTLRSIYLADIKLGRMSWSDGPFYHTSDLLKELAQYKHLESVGFSRFTEGSLESHDMPVIVKSVIFEPHPNEPKKGSETWKFEGTPEEMRQRLGRLAGEYILTAPG